MSSLAKSVPVALHNVDFTAARESLATSAEISTEFALEAVPLPAHPLYKIDSDHSIPLNGDLLIYCRPDEMDAVQKAVDAITYRGRVRITSYAAECQEARSCCALIALDSSARDLDRFRDLNHVPPFATLPDVESLGRVLKEIPFTMDLLTMSYGRPLSPQYVHHTNFDLVSGTIVEKVAEANEKRVVAGDNSWDPATGFAAAHSAQEISSLLQTNGSRLVSLTLEGRLLGYCIYFVEPTTLPPQAYDLIRARSLWGEIDESTVGFAKRIEVTEEGRELGRSHKMSVYDFLHQTMVEDAREFGLEKMIAECRGYPHPNAEGMRGHERRG